MSLLAFDLETTGVDTSTARIWQVATNEREWIINPGVPIPAEVREICRIDEALMARIEASPRWEQVQEEVLAHLCQAKALVTMNGLRYDLPVLRAHIGDAFHLPPVIDVRVLGFEALPDIPDHEVDGVVYSGHKLSNMALQLGLITGQQLAEGAHDARFDCRLTLEVLQQLPSVRHGLKALLAFQEEALALQEADWERFGVAPAEGPAFLWFRSCRACRQVFSGRKLAFCERCGGWGILHQTKKRRGQRVDAGFLRWLRGLENCPAALKKRA